MLYTLSEPEGGFVPGLDRLTHRRPCLTGLGINWEEEEEQRGEERKRGRGAKLGKKGEREGEPVGTSRT